MNADVQHYVLAADRDNTVLTYASALRHFESEWKGLLPTTADTVARYLAEHAAIYRMSTLRLHLAALARWHADNGFADPTRSPLVRKVLRGIRAKHAVPQRRARPLQLDVLEAASDWLDRANGAARQEGRLADLLRHTRDRSLLLLGFWRAFRADELANMRVEEVVAERGKGMTCTPGRTKTSHEDDTRIFHCPALSRLCPVDAYLDWIEVSGRKVGPVYSAIDRWGHLSNKQLATNAVLPLLQRILRSAGATDATSYSSHSLRRGFAGWASSNGWDLKELMVHVGWRNVASALRYIDVPADAIKAKFEHGLAKTAPAPAAGPLAAPAQDTALSLEPSQNQVATIHLRLLLSKPGGSSRGTERARKQIEEIYLKKYAVRNIDRDKTRFELQVPFHDRDALDEVLLDLLDEIYSMASANECILEGSFFEPATGVTWD